jgi:hypothetical protein
MDSKEASSICNVMSAMNSIALQKSWDANFEKDLKNRYEQFKKCVLFTRALSIKVCSYLEDDKAAEPDLEDDKDAEPDLSLFEACMFQLQHYFKDAWTVLKPALYLTAEQCTDEKGYSNYAKKLDQVDKLTTAMPMTIAQYTGYKETLKAHK